VSALSTVEKSDDVPQKRILAMIKPRIYESNVQNRDEPFWKETPEGSGGYKSMWVGFYDWINVNN
jgi:hypothetical protein